jgi:putative MATE family efflux protein
MGTSTDLLKGNILKSLLLFAVPLMVSSLFQRLYNTVDTMIVGHFLGDQALAAVGASMSVSDLLIGFALGFGNGLGIVVAKVYGMQEGKTLRHTVASALMTGLGVTVAAMLLGEAFLRPLLTLLQTPAEIFDRAYGYVHVLTLFVGVTFAYNLFSSLLRAIGNSVMPFVFLLISSALNVALDLLFVVRFGLGVQGTAVATVLSQGASAVLCLIYFIKKCPLLLPEREDFAPDREIYRELVGQGLSMGFMMAIVSVGTLILQSAINKLGTLIIAGHTAARKLNSLCDMPGMSLALATSTFVSQNRGANQRDRILRAMRYTAWMCVAWAALISVVLYFFAPALIFLLTGSTESVVIENGARYLRFNAPFYSILGILQMLRYGLQALGQKVVPLISSVIELVGKVLFVIFLIPQLQYFGVIICEPVIWCCMCAQLAFSFFRNPYIRGRTTPVV